MIVVSDTSAISGLIQIGRINIIIGLFEAILLPQAVVKKNYVRRKVTTQV